MRRVFEMWRRRSTWVILLPVTGGILESMNEDGLLRSAGLASQLLSYTCIRGLCDSLPDRALSYQPSTGLPLEATIETILVVIHRSIGSF